MYTVSIADNFDSIYKRAIGQLLAADRVIARGFSTRELTNYSYELTDVNRSRIDFSTTGAEDRQAVYDRYAEAEIKWYQSGNLAASSAPSKFWLKLADAKGEIVSNYGYLVLFDKAYGGLSAFDHVVAELRRDSFSRRAVIHYSRPDLALKNPLDIPCTVSAQVMIRHGRINMTVFQRSCDILKGISYDVVWHAWLIKKLAEELGVLPGSLHHLLGSLHLYESDVILAESIVRAGKRAIPVL
jgi:thymidylate synthase